MFPGAWNCFPGLPRVIIDSFWVSFIDWQFVPWHLHQKHSLYSITSVLIKFYIIYLSHLTKKEFKEQSCWKNCRIQKGCAEIKRILQHRYQEKQRHSEQKRNKEYIGQRKQTRGITIWFENIWRGWSFWSTDQKLFCYQTVKESLEEGKASIENLRKNFRYKSLIVSLTCNHTPLCLNKQAGICWEKMAHWTHFLALGERPRYFQSVFQHFWPNFICT